MKHANIAVFVPHSGCPQQCSFCNQKTISGHATQPTAEDVKKACETAMVQGREGRFVQLAFFGGSFTAIDKSYMLSLLEAAQPYIKSGFLNGGIRISTRPDFIDDEILTLLQKYGVRAIELGAQSTDEKVLSINKRGHTAAEIFAAAKKIKEYGFELGLQMMTGLYGSTPEKDIKTAEDFIFMRPDTVRIYPTVVLKNTLLGELFEKGEYNPPDVESTVELCAELLQMFESSGIKVIRLGLHAQDGVEQDYLAGAYHPALRELCEGEQFYRRILKKLKDKPEGSYEISVNKKDISRATGQKKKNLLRLKSQGYTCKVSGDDSIQLHEFTLRNVTECF